jgi:predicted RNase H-like HicB family nuclease
VKARYTVVLDREVDGRAMASVPGLPGCHAYGRTPSEAVRRVKSAVRFYLKQVMKQGQGLPRQPKPITVEIQLAV